MIHNQTKKMEWEAPEHSIVERRPDWFWGIGILTVAGIVIAILTKNYLLAFIILISGVLLVLFSLEKPKTLRVEVSEQGIKVNRDLYPFRNLKSFWLYESAAGRAMLMLNADRSIRPIFSLPLAQTVDPVILRNELLKFIPEVEYQESLTDKIAEKIGF